MRGLVIRPCEERSDEAIQRRSKPPLDCFAPLAMTAAPSQTTPPYTPPRYWSRLLPGMKK
jgi:hypothetical protein